MPIRNSSTDYSPQTNLSICETIGRYKLVEDLTSICHFHREQSDTKHGNSEVCVRNRVSCEEPASYDANLIFLRNFQNHCDSFKQPIHLEYFNEVLTNTNIKERRILPNEKCKWSIKTYTQW